jgi:hypothetical protein
MIEPEGLPKYEGFVSPRSTIHGAEIYKIMAIYWNDRTKAFYYTLVIRKWVIRGIQNGLNLWHQQN